MKVRFIKRISSVEVCSLNFRNFVWKYSKYTQKTMKLFKESLFNKQNAVTNFVVYKHVWRSTSLFFGRVRWNAVRLGGGGSYHCLHCQTCHYRVLWLSTISTPCNMVLFGKGPLRRHRLFSVKTYYITSRTPSNMEQYNERCYVLLYLDWHLFTQCQSLLPLLSLCVLQTWRLRYLLQEKQAKQGNLIQRTLTVCSDGQTVLFVGHQKKNLNFRRGNLIDLNQICCRNFLRR